jgi:hypothetical protein
LRFDRDGKKIKLVGFDLHSKNEYYVLSIEFESEELSYYVRQDWTDRCHRALAKARREAYEQGYKDAKAKRKRAEWFSSSLEVE